MTKYLIVVVTTAQVTSKPGQRCANVLVEKSVPGEILQKSVPREILEKSVPQEILEKSVPGGFAFEPTPII